MVHRKVWQSLALAALISLLFPTDALAYIDPGSGSLIFQTLIAALAGIAYAVRVYWAKIRSWLPRRGGDGASGSGHHEDAASNPQARNDL